MCRRLNLVFGTTFKRCLPESGREWTFKGLAYVRPNSNAFRVCYHPVTHKKKLNTNAELQVGRT